VPVPSTVATARAVRVFAFTPVVIELCPVKVSKFRSAEEERYPVLVAEPLKRSAFGNVVPSIAMVCNGVEGVVEVELTSTIEAVVLLADAVA
jgi:hypothetical protein